MYYSSIVLWNLCSYMFFFERGENCGRGSHCDLLKINIYKIIQVGIKTEKQRYMN
jgi:hypothetical protein